MASVLMELRAGAEVESHIGELRRMANDGTLTPGEDAEHKDFVEALDRISINAGKGPPLPRQAIRLSMDPSSREVVRRRAGNAYEYCRMPQEATPLIPFHVEHIVSRQHGGAGDPSGLALACDRCNAYKAPNLTSIDPDTRTVAALLTPD